jgi:hypothetical protein
MRQGIFRTFVVLFGTLAILPAQAKVTRVVVEDIKSPAFDGRAFGPAGQYEILSGHVFGVLNPEDPHNAIITDIALAPRYGHGMVVYSATFTLIKPVDMSRTSGVLIYQVPNRGGVLFGTPDDSGNVILTSGWQGDIPPRAGLQTIAVPVARNADRSSVTGPAIAILANMPPGQHSLPLTGGIGLGTPRPEPASLRTATAQLTKRTQDGGRTVVSGTDWAFADCGAKPFPGTRDPHRLCLKDGFDPAYLYELTYIAKNPPVLGIGFAATRDINAFFKGEAHDRAGFANPLAGRIHAAIAIGFSQSGNFLRSFINLGFNLDETNRVVWDGVESNIAGRQLAMNLRFAAPGGAAGVDEPGSEGVLWWGGYDDSMRGRGRANLLDRCRATDSCPKIFELFGSSEFWGLRMSPNLVGTDANADIPLPAKVRRYYFPGVTHGGGKGGFATAPDQPAQSITGPCLLSDNPNPSSDTTRALTSALLDWVTKGIEPPPSRYPTMSAGQLVAPTAAAMGFPKIPGAPSPDGKLNPFLDYDFGPDFNYQDLSGIISVEPPVVKRTLPSLVPKVDTDGNEIDGAPSALFEAPLGTYLGWNVTAGGFYKGQGCGFSGGFIPFANTKAERTASADPRPSLEERYGTHDAYVARVRAAAERLVSERLLLPDDRDRIVSQAEASDVLRR